MLDARLEVVPFHGRATELAELAKWRDDPAPLAALLVHGPAGAGKTRLVNRFRDQWDDDSGRLVVIDDVDHWAWPDLFAKLQDSLREDRSRVLMTARTTGWWWSSTRQRIADFDFVISDLELEPTLRDRGESFTLACRHFARALHVEESTDRPPAIADETVLDLHMAALTAVHGDPVDVNRTQLVRQLKVRDTGKAERRLAEDYLAVAPPEDPDPDLLVRAATRWPHLVPRVDELFTNRAKELVDTVELSTLRTLADFAGMPTLEAVARQVFHDADFATDALPAKITLRLVEHAVRYRDDLLEQAEMWGMLSARTALAGLREEAADASQKEVDAYRELAKQDPEENRPMLADALGDLGLRLIALDRHAEVLAVSEEALELWKEIANEDPETVPQLAAALEQISFRYSALGMREEAMDSISRAAVMFQGLAKMHPALFRLDFARVAGNLGRRLFAVGRREEAADVMQYSLAHWRELAKEDPRFEPELARNLAVVGRILVDFGRHAPAAEAVEESIVVYRRLVDANPAFLKELADALVRHSQLLDEVDKEYEARLVAEEAVVLCREIAKDDGGVALAEALLNIGEVTLNYDVEYAAAAEAALLLRRLAEHNPVHHQVDYARALAKVAEMLLIGRRRAEAYAKVTEILAICQRLPQQLIVAFGPRLALSLHTLGRALSELGHHDHAITVTEQVVDIWRSIAHRNQAAPVAYILAVHQLAMNLRGAERHVDARNTAHTELVLWQMTKTPDELDQLPSYADALSAYGRLCAETKHDLENALVLCHRAVLIMRDKGAEPIKLELAVEALDAVVEAFDDRQEAQNRLEALVSSS